MGSVYTGFGEKRGGLAWGGWDFFLFTKVLAVSDDDSLLDASFAQFFFDFFPLPVGVSICLKIFNSRCSFWCLVSGPGRVRGFPSPRKFVLFVWVGGCIMSCVYRDPANTTGSI